MKSRVAHIKSSQSCISAVPFIARHNFRNQPKLPSLSLGLVAVLAFGCGATNDVTPSGSGAGTGATGNNAGVGATGNNAGVGATGNNAGVGATGNNAGVGAGATGNNAGVGATGNNAGVGATGNNAGAITGCVIGSQGCICDSSGRCASGLTCSSGVCCNSGNCSMPAGGGSAGGGNGNAGSGNGNAGSGNGNAGSGNSVSSNGGGNSSSTVCTPGVTGPVITDCGYPYTSSNPLTSVVFNESTVLKGIVPTGGAIATVRVFYNDEHALTLGVRRVVVVGATGSTTTDYPVSTLGTDPDNVFYPQVGTTATSGDQAGLDPSGRPMWPALFITDTTNNPNDTSGDWQQGGTPYSPNAVYGTWKSALITVTQGTSTTVTTPDTDPASNNWNLGTGADAVPSSITSPTTTTTTGPGQPPPAQNNEAYSAEIVWNLSLLPGHTYRVQVIVHDGDQNKVGGDSGEGCVNFCAGTDVCQPVTCAAYGAEACGQLSDQCGGTINCGSCGCTPQTCEQACAAGQGCQTNYDEVTGYTQSCPQSSGCSGTIQCYCFIG